MVKWNNRLYELPAAGAKKEFGKGFFRIDQVTI